MQLVSVSVSVCVCTCVLVHVQVTWIQLYVLGGLKSTGSFIVWPYFAVTESWMNLQCCVRKAEQMLTVNIADRPHILCCFLMHWLSHLHSFCMFVISCIWGIGALLCFTLIKSNSKTGHLFSRHPASTVLHETQIKFLWLTEFLVLFFNPLQSVEFTKKMLNTSFSWVCN